VIYRLPKGQITADQGSHAPSSYLCHMYVKCLFAKIFMGPSLCHTISKGWIYHLFKKLAFILWRSGSSWWKNTTLLARWT